MKPLDLSSGFRSLHWLVLAVVLVIAIGTGIVIGIMLDRFVLPYRSSGGGDPEMPAVRNPSVTRETYVRIKPDMTTWEVNDLLGSGEIVAEEGFIVDEQGRFKQYSRNGGAFNETTGTVNAHDGKPKKEIRQEVVWHDGSKAIFVTFFNGKVIDKREKNLFRE
jgi:hypothetical protein